MKAESGNSVPLWTPDVPMPARRELTGDIQADLCVIGAGIAGLTTAYLMLKEGRSVVVLDDGEIAGGESCRTTAHLSNEIDDRYTEMERIHGPRGARLAAEAHTAAINRIEAICREENFDCDFQRVDGYLFLAPGQEQEMLQQEFHAAHRAGLVDIAMLGGTMMGLSDIGPCIRFPMQGQFHPTRYFRGLAEAIVRMGGAIYNAHAKSDIRGGRTVIVHTSTGATIRAQSMLVATNTPISDRVTIHTKQAPYRTYAIAARVPRGRLERALYWDMADPYHYVRTQPGPAGADYDYAIVGGEDHKTGHDSDPRARWDNLEGWVRRHLPVESVEFRWSGQVMETLDGLAYIGPDPSGEPNVYVATGDSGMGMTHGTIAGMLITDMLCVRENVWDDLFDPQRVRVGATSEFLRENVDVAAQYGQWLTGSEVDDIGDIAPGSGAVMRSGLKKVAVYRDEAGHVHQLTATCPHLGCLVSWNAAEKSWDCPCHGSRFTAMGKLINGPANSDLEVAAERVKA